MDITDILPLDRYRHYNIVQFLCVSQVFVSKTGSNHEALFPSGFLFTYFFLYADPLRVWTGDNLRCVVKNGNLFNAFLIKHIDITLQPLRAVAPVGKFLNADLDCLCDIVDVVGYFVEELLLASRIYDGKGTDWHNEKTKENKEQLSPKR